MGRGHNDEQLEYIYDAVDDLQSGRPFAYRDVLSGEQELVSGMPRQVVLAGDFNALPSEMDQVFGTPGGRGSEQDVLMHNSMRAPGWAGMPNTNAPSDESGWRIDHILVSPSVEVRNGGVVEIEPYYYTDGLATDHNAVIADLSFGRRQP